MKVKVTQLCLTLYDPMDYSTPGSSVPGILQARILEWVAIPFSRGSSDPGIKLRSSVILYDLPLLLIFKHHLFYIFWGMFNTGAKFSTGDSASCSVLV